MYTLLSFQSCLYVHVYVDLDFQAFRALTKTETQRAFGPARDSGHNATCACDRFVAPTAPLTEVNASHDPDPSSVGIQNSI